MKSTLLRIAIKSIPPTPRAYLRKWHQRWTLDQAMSAFVGAPLAALDERNNTVERLIYGWGNEAWSADATYLRECVRLALSAKLPVLECGSGLSTLLLSAACRVSGVELWTLEHLPTWAERTKACLRRFDLPQAQLCVAPLRHYGQFEWYEAPLDRMPPQFGLVICDGPPSSTQGGRYGLIPVMRARLSANCVILLDDAQRPSEAGVMSRWANEVRCSYSLESSMHGYFKVNISQFD